MKNMYRNFKPQDVVETDLYNKHLHAMTGEQLHAKAEIAAELASRDLEIKRLRIKLNELNDCHVAPPIQEYSGLKYLN